MKETIETKPWDIVDHLKTEAEIAAYLEAALEEGDGTLLLTALQDIARAKKMTSTLENIVQPEGQSLDDLVHQDRPDLEKVLKLIKALGISLHVKFS